ncbi:MAG: hypothetical protein U5K99_06705 [Anaerolineales bacterium]|nr:hypothetical protein [Anaerolineales bacterium]
MNEMGPALKTLIASEDSELIGLVREAAELADHSVTRVKEGETFSGGILYPPITAQKLIRVRDQFLAVKKLRDALQGCQDRLEHINRFFVILSYFLTY